MTAPVAVDVLAVLDHAIVVLQSARRGASAESLGGISVESVQAACARIAGRLEHVEEARAAVAELIEAASDVARIQINRRSPSNDMGKAKQLRLRAALARVGAAP